VSSTWISPERGSRFPKQIALDCLWSMDCIERVGKKVREDIWFTVLADDVVTPEGCQEADKGNLVSTRLKVDTNGVE
jgi:hypothetical protein